MHYEFAPRGQTINKEYYVEVLKRLRDAVRRKRPCFWSSGDWVLHHDIAPIHSSNLVQQFLAKHKDVQLRQPPYSPDIAPCDFWMLPKLKIALKRKRFDNIEMIQSDATRELKAILKSAFEDCFKMWKLRWERVVQSNGDYFVGCHVPDDEEYHQRGDMNASRILFGHTSLTYPFQESTGLLLPSLRLSMQMRSSNSPISLLKNLSP